MRLQQCMNAIWNGNGKWMGGFVSFVKKKKKIREPKQEFLTGDLCEKMNRMKLLMIVSTMMFKNP